jgi:hypothetical protein
MLPRAHRAGVMAAFFVIAYVAALVSLIGWFELRPRGD